MSRCFPFPPPGYEKIRPDSAGLVIKEKHKKPKKDKEKKERSEGKDKAKSERHKDDKDRKEKKHRDKKHKKRDKHKSSEEKNNAGLSENRDGGRLVPDDSKQSNEIEDSRILVQLGKSLRADDGALDSHRARRITSMDQRMPKLLEELEHRSDHTVERSDISRMANAQYFKVVGRDSENGFVADQNEKIKQRSNDVRGGEHKRERRESKKAEDNKSSVEKKEMVSNKEPIKRMGNNGESADFRKPSNGSMKNVEHQGSLPKRRAAEPNGFIHEVNGTQPNIVPRAVSYVHQDQDNQNGSGSYPRQNLTNVAARKAIPPSTHMVNGKPVGNNVVSRPETGQRPNNQLVSKDFVPSPQLGIGKKTEPPKVEQRAISNHITTNHGRATANNHMVSNGFVPSQKVDMGKKTESFRTLKFEQRVVNDRRVDENHSPSLQPFADSERKVAVPNFDKALDWRGQEGRAKIDEKDSRNNGTNDDAKQHSSSSSTKAKEKSKKSRKDKSDRSMKLPHPDLKYLDQILTVPQVDWPISGDQEWLFGCCSESPAKRPKLAAPSLTEPTKEVWAEAMRLEPADVIALPYVIPY